MRIIKLNMEKDFGDMYIIEHHLFMEEEMSHSMEKEICSSFNGMCNIILCTKFFVYNYFV